MTSYVVQLMASDPSVDSCKTMVRILASAASVSILPCSLYTGHTNPQVSPDGRTDHDAEGCPSCSAVVSFFRDHSGVVEVETVRGIDEMMRDSNSSRLAILNTLLPVDDPLVTRAVNPVRADQYNFANYLS